MKDEFFIFIKNFTEQCIHCSPQFCSTTFCHFFRQWWNSILPKLFTSLSKELFQVPFTVFQGIVKFFHYENFVKTEINRHPKLHCLVNTMNESELSTQAVTALVWSSKKHVVLHCPDERLCSFYWLILDAFHLLLPSVGLFCDSTC